MGEKDSEYHDSNAPRIQHANGLREATVRLVSFCRLSFLFATFRRQP